MSSSNGEATRQAERPADKRAEELMERTVKQGARLFGRIREEIEDIVAEGRTMHDRSRSRSRS